MRLSTGRVMTATTERISGSGISTEEGTSAISANGAVGETIMKDGADMASVTGEMSGISTEGETSAISANGAVGETIMKDGTDMASMTGAAGAEVMRDENGVTGETILKDVKDAALTAAEARTLPNMRLKNTDFFTDSIEEILSRARN